jgi:hypothetical protein
MSFDLLGELNWLAVIVATIVYFALGAVWYTVPAMSKAWMRATGIQVPERGQGPGPGIYVVPLATAFVASVATGMLAQATGSQTFGEGIVLGLVVGVGYALTLTAVQETFGMRPQPGVAFLINGGYQFLGLLIVAVIVSVWR